MSPDASAIVGEGADWLPRCHSFHIPKSPLYKVCDTKLWLEIENTKCNKERFDDNSSTYSRPMACLQSLSAFLDSAAADVESTKSV